MSKKKYSLVIKTEDIEVYTSIVSAFFSTAGEEKKRLVTGIIRNGNFEKGKRKIQIDV